MNTALVPVISQLCQCLSDQVLSVVFGQNFAQGYKFDKKIFGRK
jgi:hypothetical protein